VRGQAAARFGWASGDDNQVFVLGAFDGRDRNTVVERDKAPAVFNSRCQQIGVGQVSRAEKTRPAIAPGASMLIESGQKACAAPCVASYRRAATSAAATVLG
jgi:hypothetical protein